MKGHAGFSRGLKKNKTEASPNAFETRHKYSSAGAFGEVVLRLSYSWWFTSIYAPPSTPNLYTSMVRYFEIPPRGVHFPLLMKECVSIFGILCLPALLLGCIWNAKTVEKKSDQAQVLFTYEGEFQTVCLSGDFNDWSPNTHCLKRSGDRWTIKLFLSPGRYRYGFILDGSRWTPDPSAFLFENDGFGAKNSVLIVE